MQSQLSNEAKNTATKPYDPGFFISCVELIPNSKQFAVKSYKGDETYIVDLKAQTCTCKSFEHRGTCKKHIRDAAKVSSIAASWTSEKILDQIQATQGDAEKQNLLIAAMRVSLLRKEGVPVKAQAAAPAPAPFNPFQLVVDPAFDDDFFFDQVAA